MIFKVEATYISDNKLFKIYLPEVLGGILLSLPETLIHQQEISEMELNQVSRVCKKAAKAALMSGHTIFPLLGIQAIMEHSTVNQI